jgi:hypothetical protein
MLIKSKFSGFLADGTRTPFMGGGGGGGSPAPVTQNVSNTNIPAYAQPYVENMLGQAAALTDINQNPYQTYGGQRIANFSDLQRDAFANVANQTTAAQLTPATGYATASGAGSLQSADTAGMYGGMGSGYGNQAAGMAPQAQQYGQNAANIGMGGLGYGALGAGYGQQATNYGAAAAGMAPEAQALGAYGVGVGAQGQRAGQQASRQSSMYGMGAVGQGQQGANIGASLGQQSTDPNAVQSYMNPYIQASLQPQLNLLNQQAGLQGAAQQGAATSAGAFGGSRSALANSLSRQNSLMAQQQAIGQGYNQAYSNAQNQMNAANQAALSGNAQALQGYGMGLQGAQQAGQLGIQGAGVGLQGQQAGLAGLNQASSLYGQGIQGAQAGMQGAGVGLQGLGTAMQGQQAGLQGLQQAGNLLGQGMTGAQIGLQGVGAQQAGYAGANQAAGTLGQLGQTQFGQQQAINQAQQTTGAVQQAQAQQVLDQSYQDFLKQKNYPYQQLAFMGDMTRGLPLSQTANTMYSAPPNAASQLGGLGMSALGIYGMSGGFKAKGGMVGEGHANGGLMAAKRYKEGGYADGGQPMSGEAVIKQLTEMLDNPELTPLEVEAIQKKIMMYQRMLGNPQAQEIMAPAEGRSGIGAISTGNMVPEEGMAGGGIVAFAQGGLKRPETEMDYTDLIKQRLAAMDTGNPFAKSEEETQAIRKSMEERKTKSPWEALAMAGLGTMAGTSQYGLTNVAQGGMEGLKSYSRSAAENAADQKLLLQQQVEAEKGKYARDTGNLNALIQAQSAKDTKALGLLNAKNTASATAANQEYNNFLKASTIYSNAVTAEKRNLYKANKDKFNYDVDNAELDMEARANVARTMPKIAAVVGGGAPTNPIDAPDPKANPGAKTDPKSLLPMPQTKDALVKGKSYNTSKGPAKWDGSQFIPI